MAPPNRKTQRASERRKQRRQRLNAEGNAPERGAQTPRMAPLSLDPRKKQVATPTLPVVQLNAEEEYVFVRRDLWRLTVFSALCFALMIAVLFWLNA